MPSPHSTIDEKSPDAFPPSRPVTIGFDFPTPQEYPESDIVIFDGQCLFCQSQLKKLVAWDGKNRLSFVSLHDPYVAEHFPQLTHDAMMKEMFAVDRSSGKTFGGARALRFYSRRLPKLWWAAPLLHLPLSLPLWNWIYRFIAKRRYRLSQKIADRCSGGSCELHFGEKK